MTVNLEKGTTLEDVAALIGTESEPTEPTEEAEQEAADQAQEEPVTEEAGEADEDAELEAVANEDDSDEAEEETELHTVKINGEEQKVTLQELKDGFMKDADYRRKTAEAAEHRKKAEAMSKQFEGALSALQERLTLAERIIEAQTGFDESELDKLAESNPAAFIKAQREQAKRQALLNAIREEQQMAQSAMTDKQKREYNEFRAAEQSKLYEKNPEFKNAETVQRLHNYLAESYGFVQQEIDSVIDHRFALLAEKARRYDALKAKAAVKDKKVQKVAKVQKGGAVNRSTSDIKAQQRAFETVLKSGSVKDLAALL